jgi:hypothetical protein
LLTRIKPALFYQIGPFRPAELLGPAPKHEMLHRIIEIGSDISHAATVMVDHNCLAIGP